MHDKIDAAAAPRGSVASRVRIGDELRWRIAVALLAIVLAGAGTGGYLIGSSSDVDLDAVRSAAAAEGREAGAATGSEEGYTRGYEAARQRTYAAAYSAAYREAYAGEFESVGLDPPERIRVRGPR